MAEWDIVEETSANPEDPWRVVASTPKYKGKQAALRRALTDIDPAKKTIYDTPSGRMLNTMLLGAPDLTRSAMNALLVDLQNRVPGGVRPAYTGAERFEAERLAANARRAQFSGKHPLTATGLDIGGSLMTPGARTIGGWVVGSKAPALAATGAKVPLGERVLQTGRAATAGGALTGAQAGVQARPGEELERAKTGAATGAVLAPVLGGAVGVGMRAAPAVARGAKRLVGKGPSAEITSIEKLQRALRQAGVTPDAIHAASDEWATTGGITPALIDLVKDAGGSSEVLRLLARSPAKAPARRAVEKYAEETVGGTQREALEQIKKLPTGGETRTPSQIRADLDVERAAIDAGLEAKRGTIGATLEAGTVAPPAAPRPRETGAAAFSDELNRLYDESEAVYKEAYKAAEAAAPEAAFVDDVEVRPLFEKLRASLKGMNPRLEGVGAVERELEHLKRGIAPGDINDWPEGEVMDLAKPLTVQDLEFLRQKMVELAEKHGGAAGGAAANRVKATVDAELDRLAAEGKFQGDPAIVETWKAAIQGRREHGEKFGSGLAAELTARKPDGSRMVEPERAGDVIFGASPSQVSLNKSLSKLEGSLDLVSPEAARALREELYGRVKVEDIPKLRETTGGRKLLPEDLSDEALAAREATRQAEEAAQEATRLAEESAAAQREGLERGPEAALTLGERALKTPTEEFEPAIGAVGASDLPITASGARQAVLDVVEKPEPGATGVLQGLLSARASKNLGLAVSPDDIARMQAQIRNLTKRGKTAQQLEYVAGTSAMHTDPLLETVSQADLAYPRRGIADVVVNFLRKGHYLSDREYEAAVRALTSKNPAMKEALLSGLLQKYPAAKRAISPFLARPAAGEGDEFAVETLSEEYGVP